MIQRFASDEEVADLIKVVQPWEDDFEDVPPVQEDEPRALDFNDEGSERKFIRGYN